jgi:formylmethanofuran dehydrogenase subunit E
MVLGVRMAVAGMGDLGLQPLDNNPRLRVVVETARCAADAIQAVSDTSLGRSSLRVAELGKVAATFSLRGEEVGVRVVALESSRDAADRYFPELKGRKERQMTAYQALPDDALLKKGRVRLLETEGRPARHPHPRAICPKCAEAFDQRFGAFEGGELLCASCAGRSYFEPLPPLPAGF